MTSVVETPVARFMLAILPDHQACPLDPDLAKAAALSAERAAIALERNRIDDEIAWLEYIAEIRPEEALLGAARIRRDIERLDGRRAALSGEIQGLRR